MSSNNRDPLLEKLRARPVKPLDPARSARTLSAMEDGLARKVRPGVRWPEIAIGVALSLTGVLYTVGSVNKLEEIYVSNQVMVSSPQR